VFLCWGFLEEFRAYIEEYAEAEKPCWFLEIQVVDQLRSEEKAVALDL
jgi:hypothetical protein